MTRDRQNETFIAWMEQYGAMLRKMARVYAAPGEHGDLHQDLLIAVWKAVPFYREQARPSTFIYRVALNRALNWNRGIRDYRRRHDQLDVEAATATPAPSDSADGHEARVAELYAALGRLPEADRALALLYLEDLSYGEIGEILGITETNVGARLSRLRKRLAADLQEKAMRERESI